MRTVLAIAFATMGLQALAQVRVDRPVRLVGGTDAARQVQGLPEAQAPEHALDAATDQRGTAHWAGDGQGAAWSVDLPGLQGPPTAGLALVVRTTVPQSGEVSLSVNGAPGMPVVMRPGEPLLGDALPPGTVVSLVFDGSAFQVTNGATHLWRPCLPGTLAASEHYCIEPNERPLSTWYEAAQTCVQNGMRLCTWSEWQQACANRTAIGLNDMVGNWEWTNNTANEDLQVRMVGNLNCGTSSTRLVGDPLVYRCCYSR